MALDRLTQITSSGISSTSTITVSAIAGILTATSATVGSVITMNSGGINVGSAVTIHSGGFRIGSSDLHSSGLTVQNLNATGVVTATSFIGNVTGNATGLSGTPNITVGTIGATSLNASGVVTATTFSGNVTGNVSGNVTGNLTGNVNSTGVSTFTTLLVGTGVTISGGIVTATSFRGDGSNLTNTGSTLSAASGSQRVVLTGQTSGTMTASATDSALTFAQSTGTLSATKFSGDGSALTGIAATTNVVTNSLVVSGVSTVAAGSTAVPSISPTGDSNTGIFFPAADTVSIGEGGSEALRINDRGQVLLGVSGFAAATSPTASYTQYTPLHLIGGTGTNNGSSIFIARNTPSTNAANQDLGNIIWGTNDGAPFARIGAWADGTPTGSSYPGYLSFQTTASGGTTPSERWRIDKNGLLHNANGQHAHGSVNFSSDYKCQFGTFSSAESGTNGSAAVGSGPFDSTYKNSEWDNKTLTYGFVNELSAEYNLSQASRCNIGAHFYMTNSGGGDYNFPTGGSGTSYWTPNGSAIWATAAGLGGYVGYAAIRADVQSYYASGAAFYARVKNGATSGVGYGYHCDLGGHPFGNSNVGYYVRQMDDQNMTGCYGFMYRRHNSSNTFNVLGVFNSSNTQIGGITCTNTNTAFPTSSDYRLKENVAPLTGASERIKQIPVHRFNFIESPEITQDGFLAHELQPIVPLAVGGEKDEVETRPKQNENGEFVYTEENGEKTPVFETVPKYQTVDYSKVVPLLTAALQEALAEIETLKNRLDAAGL